MFFIYDIWVVILDQDSKAQSTLYNKHARVIDKLIREKRYVALVIMWFCTGLMKLLSYTYRYKIVNESYFKDTIEKHGSFIYAFWHQNIISSIFSKGKSIKAVCLISKSRDGDLIAYPCESLGMKVLRGSSGKMAVGVKRDFEKCLLDGYSGVIAIDGPVGPPFRVKYGSISFSSNTQIPIVPYRAFSAWHFRVPTWDRMLIPIPFSTIHLVYGEPLTVDKGVDKSEYSKWANILEQRLLKLEKFKAKDLTGRGVTKFRL